MKEIVKSYKFEVHPTDNQKVLLGKHFGCARWVYNRFLNQRSELYQLSGTSTNYHKQALELTQLKKENEFLSEVNSQTLQSVLKNLDAAFQNFFSKRAKYPRFKAKHNNKYTFHVPQAVSVEDGKLYVRKFMDGIKMNLYREVEGEIRNCTITKTASNRYFVSIVCKATLKPKPKTGKSVGLDLGIKDLVTTSDGVKYHNPKYIREYEKELATNQKHLSRKVKGSNSYEKQRIKVAIIHEKIKNCRLDNIHKITTELIAVYDVICIEDLNIKGMVKNKKLSKSITDSGWGMIKYCLQYKAGWNDKSVIKVDRFYPSSKTCSCCGNVKKDLKLYEREWTCGGCHTHHDRDFNASKNILLEGMKLNRQGLSITGMEVM